MNDTEFDLRLKRLEEIVDKVIAFARTNTIGASILRKLGI